MNLKALSLAAVFVAALCLPAQAQQDSILATTLQPADLHALRELYRLPNGAEWTLLSRDSLLSKALRDFLASQAAQPISIAW